MLAKVVPIDPFAPDRGGLNPASRLIRAGEVVAFPTETVYGLGANALNAAAVARIYEAKGRPANNPVIVHVPSVQAARCLVREWPTDAEALANAFWPGPITLVLPRNEHVPDIVTAGGDTVAIRIPNHPVALALLNACACPLAAPSANRSFAISPTTARHVLDGLGTRIPMILDGGPCSGGIESTVVYVKNGQVQILRPGLITRDDIQNVLGYELRTIPQVHGEALASPGLLERHYCPRAALYLATDDGAGLVQQELLKGKQVGWMPLGRNAPFMGTVLTVPMPVVPNQYAASLYLTLHKMDEAAADVIVCAAPPDDPGWEAVRDRLRRAATSD